MTDLFLFHCPECGHEWQNRDGRPDLCLNCEARVEHWGVELVTHGVDDDDDDDNYYDECDYDD